MTEVLAEEAAATAWKILKPFAVFIACALIGFAAAEGYEHSKGLSFHVFGHVFSPLGLTLSVQRDTALANGVQLQKNLDAMTANRDGWKTADGQCEDARTKANNAAADQVTDQSDKAQASASSAFNNGYVAGKAIGARSCGAPNAPTLTTASPAASGTPPNGVHDGSATDLAGLFASGSYHAQGAVRP